MSIDLTNKYEEKEFNGLSVTITPDLMGDMQVIPCPSLVRALTPLWNRYRLTEKQVYCIIRDYDVESYLDMLGFPESGHEWLKKGYAVVFTCIAHETLKEMLMDYNGVRP